MVQGRDRILRLLHRLLWIGMICRLVCLPTLDGAVFRLHDEMRDAPRAWLQWQAADPQFRELPVHPRACPPLSVMQHHSRVYYKRPAKAGGTLVSNIFAALERQAHPPAPPGNADGHQLPPASRRLPKEFFVFKDDNATQPPADAFAIASIRNVCDLYVSQWEYQANTLCEWGPREHRRESVRASRRNPVRRFELWVERSAGMRIRAPDDTGATGVTRRVGAWSRRFWCTYLSGRRRIGSLDPAPISMYVIVVQM